MKTYSIVSVITAILMVVGLIIWIKFGFIGQLFSYVILVLSYIYHLYYVSKLHKQLKKQE